MLRSRHARDLGVPELQAARAELGRGVPLRLAALARARRRRRSPSDLARGATRRPWELWVGVAVVVVLLGWGVYLIVRPPAPSPAAGILGLRGSHAGAREPGAVTTEVATSPKRARACPQRPRPHARLDRARCSSLMVRGHRARRQARARPGVRTVVRATARTSAPCLCLALLVRVRVIDTRSRAGARASSARWRCRTACTSWPCSGWRALTAGANLRERADPCRRGRGAARLRVIFAGALSGRATALVEWGLAVGRGVVPVRLRTARARAAAALRSGRGRAAARARACASRVRSPVGAPSFAGGPCDMNVLDVVTLVVALEHVWFLVLEMFLWTKPIGRKVFRTTPEFAEQSAALAANQGLYNGFLAAGPRVGHVPRGPARRPADPAVLPGLRGGGGDHGRAHGLEAHPLHPVDAGAHRPRRRLLALAARSNRRACARRTARRGAGRTPGAAGCARSRGSARGSGSRP